VGKSINVLCCDINTSRQYDWKVIFFRHNMNNIIKKQTIAKLLKFLYICITQTPMPQSQDACYRKSALERYERRRLIIHVTGHRWCCRWRRRDRHSNQHPQSTWVIPVACLCVEIRFFRDLNYFKFHFCAMHACTKYYLMMHLLPCIS